MTVPLLCAIRGGPGSTTTRRRAFLRAKEAATTLHFVSVVDPRDYDVRDASEQRAIAAEIAWRNRVLARTSQQGADAPDVEYEVAVRVGKLAVALVEYAREIGADRILIGEPRPAADARLGSGELSSLVTDLGAENLAVEVLADPVF